MTKKFNKKITKDFIYDFVAEKSGIYGIAISARCRAEKQISSRGTDDDDLRVKIDGREFPMLDNSKRYFDSPAAFSGGKLHNREKTVFFFMYLSEGNHQLVFIPDKAPVLEQYSISFTGTKGQELSGVLKQFLPLQAEDGDRRPWITFVIVDLPIKSFEATIKTARRFLDSDDVKIIIDGEVKRNTRNLFRRFWFWIGSLFSKEETQKEIFSPNLKSALHYIEFWADRMPVLEDIVFKFGEFDFRPRAKVVWNQLHLRKSSSADSAILQTLVKGDKPVLAERAVEGAWTDDHLSNMWHGVEHKGLSGFVYSEGLEIEGESTLEIKNLITETANNIGMDSNLMISVTDVESNFKPYRVSSDKGKGIFQLTPIAIEEIRGKNIGYDLQDPFNARQNVEGGIRYLKWLSDRYKKSDAQYIEKILVSWICGLTCVDKSPSAPIEYEKLDKETKNFVEKVIDKYESKDKASSGFVRTAVILALFGVVVFAVIIGLSIENEEKEEIVQGKIFETKNIPPDDAHYKLIDDFYNNGIAEEIDFRYYPEDEYTRITEIIYRGQSLKAEGGIIDAFTQDIDKDEVKELVVKLGVGASGVATHVYEIGENGLTFISLEPDLLPKGFFGEVSFVDYDDDGISEVRVDHRSYPQDTCKQTASIYEYTNGVFVLTEQINKYEPTCRKVVSEVRG